jgi:hypothetical protein
LEEEGKKKHKSILLGVSHIRCVGLRPFLEHPLVIKLILTHKMVDNVVGTVLALLAAVAFGSTSGCMGIGTAVKAALVRKAKTFEKARSPMSSAASPVYINYLFANIAIIKNNKYRNCSTQIVGHYRYTFSSSRHYWNQLLEPTNVILNITHRITYVNAVWVRASGFREART